jgi:hypothetical protein
VEAAVIAEESAIVVELVGLSAIEGFALAGAEVIG